MVESLYNQQLHNLVQNYLESSRILGFYLSAGYDKSVLYSLNVSLIYNFQPINIDLLISYLFTSSIQMHFEEYPSILPYNPFPCPAHTNWTSIRVSIVS